MLTSLRYRSACTSDSLLPTPASALKLSPAKAIIRLGACLLTHGPNTQPKWAACCSSSSGSSMSSSNPLERLRVTKDPIIRSQLLRELDSSWSHWAAQYEPSDVEAFLSKELGVWQGNVMNLALANPNLVGMSLAEQVRPSIKALKAANIDPQDIWFVCSRRTELLAIPTVLQRWLDFLSVYGLQPRDMQNFLLRAPKQLFEGTTLYKAGQVVTFLKTLGIKDEYLAPRVFAIWPEILSRDVESQLRPVVLFLMRLGVEVTDISGIICVWPELLLMSVETQLEPFVQHLRSLGCNTTQISEIIMACPHLLGFNAEELFAPRVRALADIGVSQQELKQMVSLSTSFLTTAGGIKEQIDVLLRHGFTQAQVHDLVLACPEILAEKDFELERKLNFIQDVLHEDVEAVLHCPQLLSVSLMQVLGPRHGFVSSRNVQDKVSSAGLLDYDKLLLQDDMAWCEAIGQSLADYREFRVRYEEDYTEQLTKSAAKEFQDELKKLGIYEGTD